MNENSSPDREKDCFEESSSSSTNEENDVKREEKIALFSRTTAVSTSRGLVAPFVSMIAIQSMDASGSQLGWLQSIANLLSTFFDPVFGRLSDIVKRRIPFIVFSTVAWGIPYLLLFWAQTAFQMILIVAFVNLLLSMGMSAWNALQNELFPQHIRAKLAGRVFWFDGLGSIVATIFTGIVLTLAFEDLDYQKYILIPVGIGIVLSIIGVLPFRKIQEPLKVKSSKIEIENVSLRESMKQAFRNKPFRRFTIVSMVFAFFWTIHWPMMPLKQVKILEAKAIEIAILSILFSISTILFISFGAKLSDKYGRTKLIFFSRFCMSFFPFFYILAQKVWHLYLLHFLLSALVTIGIPSIQAYLIDIIPQRQGGIFFGVYNMLNGFVWFMGSLIGGYLQEFLQNFYGFEQSVNITFAISFLGRLTFCFGFLLLRDVKKFPSSFVQIAKNMRLRRRLKP